jgi:catechol 2,3-dioxygenase-like lactoylglutathione lyase family enzyme
VTIRFNHTIIAAFDRVESARFYRELLEAREAPSWGPFVNVQLDDDVLLQFAEPPAEDVKLQHYAFLVDDGLFDRALARLRDREIEFWADPQRQRAGQTNTEHGGRGVYFLDPGGHGLELITRPYL